jgi:prephenate dehydrogenase
MSQEPTSIAAVRGAIQVAENRADLVQAATARLLTELLARNGLAPAQIVSAIFTATPDLNADFPAHAARRLGWTDVPLLGAVEIAVPGALPRVVRVLLTVSGVAMGRRLVPVYLEGAAALRPDLAGQDARGPVRTVALIGLGQIGGSIGLALSGRSSWRRIGFDLDRATAATALAAGAIDRVAESLADACFGADLAVIAVPVDAIPACVIAAAKALPGGAALVDTGSARGGITEALHAARARGIDSVGGHPLAGNEGHGFASARAEIFRGARYVLCPGGEPAAEIPAAVLALITDLGAEPLIVSSDEHDSALARTSHLPYLLARALSISGDAASARGLSGPTFRDMTRVARSDPRVAEAYCRSNLNEVRAAWAEFRERMEALLGELAEARTRTSS